MPGALKKQGLFHNQGMFILFAKISFSYVCCNTVVMFEKVSISKSSNYWQLSCCISVTFSTQWKDFSSTTSREFPKTHVLSLALRCCYVPTQGILWVSSWCKEKDMIVILSLFESSISFGSSPFVINITKLNFSFFQDV